MTTAQPQPASEPADETCPNDIARLWNGGWQRFVFPSVWLVYLGEAVSGVNKYSDGVAEVVGYAIVAAFGVCYVSALPWGWKRLMNTVGPVITVMVALTVAESFIAHQEAFVFCTYIGVVIIAARRSWSFPAVVGLAVITAFLPPLIPAWGVRVQWEGGLSVLLVGFAMVGFFMIIESNRELAEARAEVARLAAENERSRIARDLHDLLGHSLTTITVKAGLARRLGERGENERSHVEITEVEQLSRRTLSDVRAAVAGHREVTLAGEFATAREVFRAARIEVELPGSVDVLDPRLSEVFGWVLREAVTNIVRHSRADRVKVVLGPRSIEIVDDGHGGAVTPGTGLTGLRERLPAVGGTVVATGTINGFRLRAEVPASYPMPVDNAAPLPAVDNARTRASDVPQSRVGA